MTRTQPKVPCPECGAMFLPRGLASHQRQKHGVGRARPTGLEETACRLLVAVERLEDRLERLEAPAAAPGPDQLRLRLAEVLAQARAVEAERAAVEGESAAQRRVACDQELGRLRREQARLLHELGELPL